MIDIIIAVAAFLVAFGLLVAFHEFGHFWVARRLGVKVLRFSIGIGKPLFKYKRKNDDCEYVLSAIPLGGYVKMLGENEGPQPKALQAQSFDNKPIWVRNAILAAGPMANFIFAVFAFWIMYMVGILGMAPIIGEVQPGSIASNHQLRPMMEFIEVEGNPVYTWQQTINEMLPSLGDDQMRITLKQDDVIVDKTLDLSAWEFDRSSQDLLATFGITPFRPKFEPIIGEVVEGKAASKAGLQSKDRIILIDDTPIEHWGQLVQYIQKRPNQSVTMVVERAGQAQTFEFMTESMEHQGKTYGHLGIMMTQDDLPKDWIRAERYGVVESFTKACSQTWHYISLTFQFIWKMITGKLGTETLSGPIAIAEGAGNTAKLGVAYYLSFVALISVSLGVINLLPIPMLDGGHLLFNTIEFIRGKRMSEKAMQRSFMIGQLVIATLMFFAFYNDIFRLFHA